MHRINKAKNRNTCSFYCTKNLYRKVHRCSFSHDLQPFSPLWLGQLQIFSESLKVPRKPFTRWNDIRKFRNFHFHKTGSTTENLDCLKRETASVWAYFSYQIKCVKNNLRTVWTMNIIKRAVAKTKLSPSNLEMLPQKDVQKETDV